MKSYDFMRQVLFIRFQDVSHLRSTCEATRLVGLREYLQLQRGWIGLSIHAPQPI